MNTRVINNYKEGIYEEMCKESKKEITEVELDNINFNQYPITMDFIGQVENINSQATIRRKKNPYQVENVPHIGQYYL